MSRPILSTIEEMEQLVKRAFSIEHVMCLFLCEEWNDWWTVRRLKRAQRGHMKSVQKMVQILTVGCLLNGPSGLAIAQTNGPRPVGGAVSKNMAARAAHDPRKMPFIGNGDAFVDFAVPGGITTTPTSISALGAVSGFWGTKIPESVGFGVAYHGFLRSPSGALSLFDAPGAGTFNGEGTMPQAVNLAGEITGFYLDSGGNYHGFQRACDGAIFKIDVPGAVATSAFSINPEGEITGNYWNSDGQHHGFIRDRNGALTLFDPAGSGSFGTYPTSINSAGTVTGSYFDANYGEYGFVRYRDGKFDSFAITDPQDGTQASIINEAGVVSGFFYDSNFAMHGFVRAPNGSVTAFDPEGSTSTMPAGINLEGAIIGNYADASNNSHAFLRTPNGVIRTIESPGLATGIDDLHEIAGSYYIDATNAIDGFLMQLF